MEYCPYCNSDKGIEFRYFSDYRDQCFSLNLTDPYIYEHNGRMFVSECISCGRLILSDDYGGQLAPKLFSKTEMVYPTSLSSNFSIPHEVRVTYDSAKRIQWLNSEAFVLSIRKCIEITCKLHGIEKGTLEKKLKNLCVQLEIPEMIAKVAHNIRLVGNQAAHDINDINPVNIQKIDELFNVLMDYIYVLPAKLDWFDRVNNMEEGKDAPPITKDGRWVMQKGKYRDWKS
ncbi:uncharacterized protein DUF4145 [Shewanella putrefaciens]|nr:uncharacterized protein DUF4145 [Shewanella putrefaciens]